MRPHAGGSADDPAMAAFEAADFSPSEWVSGAAQKLGGLAALRRHLLDRQQALNNELGRVLQHEFPSLVQVTRDLGRHEAKLQQLCSSLEQYEGSSLDCAVEARASFALLAEKLHERRVLGQHAAHLRLLQRFAEAAGMAEELLGSRSAHHSAGSRDHSSGAADDKVLSLRADLDRLQRVANEVGRLRHLWTCGSALTAVQNSSGRWRRIQDSLVAQLSTSAEEALALRDSALVLDALRGFTEAGCHVEAELWLREWVAPQLEERLQSAVRLHAHADDGNRALITAMCAEVCEPASSSRACHQFSPSSTDHAAPRCAISRMGRLRHSCSLGLRGCNSRSIYCATRCGSRRAASSQRPRPTFSALAFRTASRWPTSH